MKRIVKIAITVEVEGKPDRVIEFDCDGAELSEERGVIRDFGLLPKLMAEVDHLAYNGQSRVMIKAWKGCKNYDSFVASEDR